MNAKVNTVADRLSHITIAMRNLAQQVMQPAQEISDAAKDLQDKRDDTMSLKEQLMIQVAKMSAAEAWTAGEINQAAKEAGKVQANRAEGEKPTAGEKAMGVFISDLRQVAHPMVAAKFISLVALRDDAWAREDDAYKNAETKEAKAEVARPCRKLWQRKYHMLMSMVRNTIDEKASFDHVQDVIDFAVANDPDLDVERIKARLLTAVKSLTDIYNDFAHDDIKCAIDFLSVIDADDLKACKVRKIEAQTSAETESNVPNDRAQTVAPKPIAAKPAKPASKPAKPNASPVTIAGLDDLDAITNDAAVAQAQAAAHLAQLNAAA